MDILYHAEREMERGLFVCLLLNGTSALFRLLVPRIVEIEHTNGRSPGGGRELPEKRRLCQNAIYLVVKNIAIKRITVCRSIYCSQIIDVCHTLLF